MLISALIPTRGRPELYFRAVESLIDQASNPDEIEILARLDQDDYRKYDGLPGTLIVDKPLGYAGQHTYNNELAKHATGKWLMIWNDDALMDTQGWDEVIESHGDTMCLLSLDNNNLREYACFPVVPRKWFDICGHLSLDTRVDTWLNAVARDAGCFIEEDRVFITHDRHDLTGNNLDQIYEDRYIDPDFYTSFDSPQNKVARERDTLLIRAAM